MNMKQLVKKLNNPEIFIDTYKMKPNSKVVNMLICPNNIKYYIMAVSYKSNLAFGIICNNGQPRLSFINILKVPFGLINDHFAPCPLNSIFDLDGLDENEEITWRLK